MTTHDEDTRHDAHDLLARLADAADGVQVARADVDAVRARAHQRDVRRRALGGTVAAAVVLGVVGVGANLLDDPRPPAIMSGTESDQPEDPTPTADDADPAVGRTSSAEFAYDHSRFGAFGVERHHAGEVEVLTTEPVEVAIGLADGRVVAQQSVPGSGGEFGRLVLLRPGEPPRVLVESGRILRLLEARDGIALFTTRTDPADGGGETEERLHTIDLESGEAIDRGMAAGHESGTDALALADDGTTVFMRCHLECTTWLGDDLASVVGLEATTGGYPSGNVYGAAITAAGDLIATVQIDAPPGQTGRVDVVVADVASKAEVARVVLPGGIPGGGDLRLEFTPDDTGIVVAAPDGAVLVEDILADPQVLVFGDGGGVTLHGPIDDVAQTVDAPAWVGPVEAYDDVVWPLPGGGAHDWTVTVGARDASDWRTDPVEVVTRFLGEVAPDTMGAGADAAVVSVERIVEEPNGASGFVSVSETAAMSEHMVAVRRIEDSPYWWVVRADTADGAVADLSVNGHLWEAYTAQGRDRRVDGHVPPGTAIEIVAFGDTPKGDLQVNGDVWRWTAEVDRGQSVGLAMVARDADGRVVHVSVLAFGAQDVVATG